MPTEEQHLLQFERNREVAQRLSGTADYDWAVVALFYAALHLIQAHLIRTSGPVRTHSERNRRMLNNDDLKPAYDAYRTLRDHSETARYECRRFAQEEFEAIRDGAFATVRDHMEALLGDTR